jgi:hypothetical protein
MRLAAPLLKKIGWAFAHLMLHAWLSDMHTLYRADPLDLVNASCLAFRNRIPVSSYYPPSSLTTVEHGCPYYLLLGLEDLDPPPYALL